MNNEKVIHCSAFVIVYMYLCLYSCLHLYLCFCVTVRACPRELFTVQ